MVVVVRTVVVVMAGAVCWCSCLGLRLPSACCCLATWVRGAGVGGGGGGSSSSGGISTVGRVASTIAMHCLRGRVKGLCLLSKVLGCLCLSLCLLR